MAYAIFMNASSTCKAQSQYAGTNALPVLFTCSFFLTLLVQPLVSGFLLQGNRTP